MIEMDIFAESVWLPNGASWRHFTHPKYAQFSDLLYPILASLVILGVRGVVEQRIFRPWGRRWRLLDNQPQDSSLVQWVQKKMTGRRLDQLDKFCETGWRWLAYLCLHILGISIMMRKPWLWKDNYIWFGYPHEHHIDVEIWWYYMIELSFYWSLFFSQFVDVKRKDFVEMFLHHVATISLMVLSWTCHLQRVGSLVLFIHDFSDHWLELAKLGRYANKQTLCDCAFVMFCTVWIVTRVVIYPTWIVYTTTVQAAQFLEIFPMYYVFNFLLTGLLLLHLFWTYYILKAAYKVLIYEDDVSDNRSDSEDSDKED